MITFTFNNITKDWIRVLPSESRNMTSQMTRNTIGVNGQHGLVVGRMTLLPRIIVIPIGIIHNGFADLQQKKRELAQWLVTQEVGDLVFSDESDIMYRAMLSAPLGGIGESPKYTTGVLEFTCYDPFRYALTSRSVPITAGGSTIVNNGSASTNFNLTFIVSDSENGLTIKHEQTNRELRIIYNFRAGDRIDLDTSRRLLKINGNNAMPALEWRSQWFELESGSNKLRVSSDVTGTITFTERWY